MTRNPIIDEIHRIRKAHAKKFNYDVAAIFEDLRRRDAECRNLAKLRPVKPRRVPHVAEAQAPYAAGPTRRGKGGARRGRDWRRPW